MPHLLHSILIPRNFTSRYYGDNGEEIVTKVSSNYVCSLLLHSQECMGMGSRQSCSVGCNYNCIERLWLGYNTSDIGGLSYAVWWAWLH